MFFLTRMSPEKTIQCLSPLTRRNSARLQKGPFRLERSFFIGHWSARHHPRRSGRPDRPGEAFHAVRFFSSFIFLLIQTQDTLQYMRLPVKNVPNPMCGKFFCYLTFFRLSAIFLLLNCFDGEETAKFAQRGTRRSVEPL